MDPNDTILRKTRWSVTTDSKLEQILRAPDIDTVVFVCQYSGK